MENLTQYLYRSDADSVNFVICGFIAAYLITKLI